MSGVRIFFFLHGNINTARTGNTTSKANQKKWQQGQTHYNTNHSGLIVTRG